jgi:unsaturated chondroitin disaccharide hydrolase
MAATRAILALAAASSALAARNATFYDLVAAQADATLAQIPQPDVYPVQGACQGCPTWATGNRGSWVAGFFSGTLLSLFADARRQGNGPAAAKWLAAAIAKNDALALNQNNTGTHDVGFMVFTSLGHQYLLTGNTTAGNITLRTASALATRFAAKVGCIQSWGAFPPANGQSEVIIDNMLNLELLWWAGEQGNSTFTAIATSHADRMIQDIFQPFNPGCVWHMNTYDYNTGALLNRSSVPQGLGLDTVWSRGQSWSVRGFAIAYRYSRLPRYLQAAQASAECFMRLLAVASDPATGLPLWDFNATAPKLFASDSSALAIATAGIIEIALASDAATRARYLAAARRYLDILLSPGVLLTAAQSDALLNNGTTSFPQFGIALPYGDYYLLEAVRYWDELPPALADEATKEAAAL